ncbi:MAG: S-adenosylmethionine:tRNA ribosyltransferase-isomerase [Anaerolineae bacterium]
MSTPFADRPALHPYDEFTLSPALEASEPPEARGLTRDQVRLMVSHTHDSRIDHTLFRRIGDYLEAGDVLAINTSGTLNAALPALHPNGDTGYKLHLSTVLPDDTWIVEVRRVVGMSTTPFYDAQAGEIYRLPADASVMLLRPHAAYADTPHKRLWIASLRLPLPVFDYLSAYGAPIRYKYVSKSWQNAYYQTVYANEPGSAEMPSAGRAFTPELITRLIAKGVQIVPLILHTGVASQEAHEAPYEEYYRVPVVTAQVINQARRDGRRVIAVGTTVVRALETVTRDGVVYPGEGWTTLVISPERGLHAVNGLLTGLHEPAATHLAMLEALVDRRYLIPAYRQAVDQRYLWHEFGDLHLILP